MKTFWKVTLASAAAAGAVLVSWRFTRAGAPEPSAATPEQPSINGDFEAAEGRGPSGELTEQQREVLLEELEDQLGA